MCLDRSGVLWVGTYGSGLSKMTRLSNLFKHFKHNLTDNNSLANNQVYAIYKDRQGLLWIGTWGGGLDCYNPASNTFIHYKHNNRSSNSISDDRISSIVEDSAGNLWIGTIDGGLNKLDITRTNFSHYRYSKNNPGTICSNRINSLFIDKSHKLWIGSLDKGLSVMDLKSGDIKNINHNDANLVSISDNRINSLFEDKLGNFWVGTSDGLNILYKGERSFQVYKNIQNDPTSISNNWVSCIQQTNDNRILIGTYGGGINEIIRTSGKLKFKYYLSRDNLPNNFIYSILADNNGNLWFGTNNGLINFLPGNKKMRGFDFSDGLQSNEFKPGAYFDKVHDIMYFGGINGFNSFVPESINRANVDTKILLTNFKVFNKKIEIGEKSLLTESINETKEIRLSYKNYLFSISFSSTNFAAPEKEKYAYMLEGLDKQWNYTDAKFRTASYNNLPGGKYVFKVKPICDGCNDKNDVRLLTIIIDPPFYYTWWFKLLSFAAIFSLFSAGFFLRTRAIRRSNSLLENKVKQRTQELEEANKTKDKFFSIIAHDLKSPFQTLLGSSDYLSAEYNSLSEDERQGAIQNIKATIKNTFMLLENLLQWSRLQTNLIRYNPEKLDLAYSLLPTINLQRTIAKNKNIDINFAVNFNINIIADVNMLTTIVRNLVSNAIKYTPQNGKIDISAKIDNKFAVISVSDTGSGIAPEILDKLFKIDTGYSTQGTNGESGTGLGLLLCKEMVEKQGGAIYAKSKLGNGSVFTFTIPRN